MTNREWLATFVININNRKMIEKESILEEKEYG